MTIRLSSAALAAVAVAATSASADSFVFWANLSGLNEVPSNTSPALGFATGTYDSIANTFSFSWLISDNLVGFPASPGAHIHRAPAGQNGPVVFGFANPDGTWALSGSATWSNLSQANIDALFAGDLYFNFHTTAFPGGEIRGQILPTPGVLAMAGAGLAFAARRRR